MDQSPSELDRTTLEQAIKIGIHLPQFGRTATRERLRDFAQTVEELGFDSLWVSDYVVIPRHIQSRNPYALRGEFSMPPDLPILEPLATLSFIAGCTERVQLGTTVLILPMRNPVLTAKWLATLDVLSNGRLIAGFGAGWMEEQFEALDAPFSNRGQRMDEYLQVIRALWTERTPTFDGHYYHLNDIGFAPRPLQKPCPPIWIGGHSGAARRRAARFGDAWHTIATSPIQLEQDSAELHRMAQAAGRTAELEVTLRLGVQLERDHVKETAERLAAYQAVGVSHVVLEPAGAADADMLLPRLQRLRDALGPVLKGSEITETKGPPDDEPQGQTRED